MTLNGCGPLADLEPFGLSLRVYLSFLDPNFGQNYVVRPLLFIRKGGAPPPFPNPVSATAGPLSATGQHEHFGA